MRGLLSFVIVITSVACGAPPGDGDAAVDASDECTTDLHCDDGVFCNGAELCDPSAPGADARGCAPPTDPACVAPAECDEPTDACVMPCDIDRDVDGDGAAAMRCGGTDCDDAEPRRSPTNVEVCDDDDLDEDCDPATYGRRDVDGDGHGDSACCNGDNCGRDCDDDRPGVSPDVPEVCNGVDDDCDSALDEDFAAITELCDGIDSDCSSHGGPATDEDADGDGYASVTATCLGLGEPGAPGSALPRTDCRDDLASVHPGVPATADTSTCDGIDNDCDPATTERTARCPSGYCAAGGVCASERRAVQVEMGDGDGTAPHILWADGTISARGQAGWMLPSTDDRSADWPDLAPLRSIRGAIQIDVAGLSGCAVLRDATVACWVADVVTPVVGLANVAAVSLSTYDRHRCALHHDGRVSCWGANDSGQLGDGTTLPRTGPVLVTGLTDAVQIESGLSHTCAVRRGGQVVCWGTNDNGELGDGGGPGRAAPTPVVGVAGAVEVDASHYHSCARLSDGSVRCWGTGSMGELGDGRTMDSATPVTVLGIGDATAIAVGGVHACAIGSAGAVACWGDNQFYGLGDGSTRRGSPGPYPGIPPASSITAGFGTCVLTTASDVWCSGQQFSLWVPDTETPAPVAAMRPEAIVAGSAHTCVLADDAATCWGQNESGQLGDSTNVGGPAPRGVRFGDPTTRTWGTRLALHAFGSSTCATEPEGQVCWGAGATPLPRPFGRAEGVVDVQGGRAVLGAMAVVSADSGLPDGADAGPYPFAYHLASYPALEPVMAGVTWLRSGPTHICFHDTAGVLRCTGSNGSGELGDGTRTSSGPVRPSGLDAGDVLELTLGPARTCAVLNDRSLRCWGANGSGQLGDGTMVDRLVPTLVPGMTDVLEVALGDAHTCALLGDGTVSCWGQNLAGQLGDGSTVDGRATPGPVTGLTGVAHIAAGAAHTCALRTGGGVLCWGANASGQSGEGSLETQRVPAWVFGI